MTKKTKNNIIFATVLILAFIIFRISSIDNYIFGAIIQSAVLLGILITWITYNAKESKLTKKITENEKISEGALFTWEAIKTVGAVALFVVFFRYFVIQPFYIIGNSMNPDFQQGEYLFIDEASYFFRSPGRGEVVVFKHPESGCTEFVENHRLWSHIAQGPCTSYIKRVIGLPGETIALKNGKFTITNKEHPEGFVLNEDYIGSGVVTLGDQVVTLGKNEYYAVGDNRQPNQSYDSRQWGPLKREFITGRAWLRLLPADKISFIKKAEY